MAERIVSPGVFTRENDLSFLSQGVGQIGAAIVGPFEKGPAFVPTVLSSQSELEEYFGSSGYFTGLTATNYLRESSTVTVVRVGHVGGYTQLGTIGLKISGSVTGEKLVGVFKSTHNWTTNGNGNAITASITSSPSSSNFVLTVSGSNSAFNTRLTSSILYTQGNDISDVYGESPRGSKGIYVSQFFEDTALKTFSSAKGDKIELVNLGEQSFIGQDIQYATTPWIQSQEISGERYNLFRFHTLGDGTIYNKLYKVSIFNVRAAGEVSTTPYSVFSLSIRGYSDTDKRKLILETYNNVTLDPQSPNYIARIIGDQNVEVLSNGKQLLNGDYGNRSKLVRVEVVQDGTFPVIAGPFGHDKYLSPITGFDTITPAVTFTTASLENNSSSATKYSGIDLDTNIVKIDNGHFLSPIPNGAGYGTNTVFSFSNSPFNFELTGSNLNDISKRQFTVGFQGGFDGVTPTLKVAKPGDVDWGSGNTQGFNLSSSTTSGSVAYIRAINSVSNPDDFDINLISVPGVVRRLHPFVFDHITSMVENREDAFFIGDLTDYNDSISLAIDEAKAVDSNYVGSYYPWVKTIDTRNNKLVTVPPSVLLPAIYASNDAIAAEWFAPAGLNRGGIVGAVSVLNRLTHSERDELYENKVNPIAQFPGEGIVAYGQKTLQERASALDRINVRRLLIKVKKYIASTSRYLVFEQNTSQTRNRFLNTVNPYLESIQQRQGLYAFRVVMDESNNTPDMIDRNMLVGQIFLQPTKTAEFIVLDFSVLPTGAVFGS